MHDLYFISCCNNLLHASNFHLMIWGQIWRLKLDLALPEANGRFRYNFFTILGEALGDVLCVYDLWAQLKKGVGRRQ